MHGLQEIIYANKTAAQKAKARAHVKRNETAQRVIAERLAQTRGIQVAHK
jgi:uncharacterized membrane protein